MVRGFEFGKDGPRSILVGIDGTATSLHAGAYAVGLARRQDAHLVVLHVSTPAGMASGVAGAGAAAQQAKQELADNLAGEIDQQLPRLGVPSWDFVHRWGNPYVELVAVAAERQVDAIVVGASMRAGHRLVGSLAGHLIRDAQWPVTVVP